MPMEEIPKWRRIDEEDHGDNVVEVNLPVGLLDFHRELYWLTGSN